MNEPLIWSCFGTYALAAVLLAWWAVRIYRQHRARRLPFKFSPYKRQEPELFRRMKQ